MWMISRLNLEGPSSQWNSLLNVMDLNEIVVFARVVRTGSFVGAARELAMPKSTVSRKVSELEERLGARLLHRTTRKLSLTDVGRVYYQHAERVVAEMEEAEQAVTLLQEAPRGLLRVSAPLNFGYLGPLMTSFLEQHTEVQLELVCTDRVVSLVEEGFDLALRVGALADSTLVARSLGTIKSVLVASPGLLERLGHPELPGDLADYPCVVFGGGARTTWTLAKDEVVDVVKVGARLVVNDFEFLEDAARSGLGVAMIPYFRCIDDIRSGELVRVLPDWCSGETPLHAVYPSTRHLSPKVVAFLDHLRNAMTI